MTTNSNYKGPGIYRHYKGGEYEVVGLSIREETKHDGWVKEVIYRPLSPGSLLEQYPDIEFWSRILDDFNEVVRTGVGICTPRFVFIREIDPGEHIRKIAMSSFDDGCEFGRVQGVLEAGGVKHIPAIRNK